MFEAGSPHASPPPSERSELRAVLVGKVGAGKTSVMKTFLRSSEDKPAAGRPSEPGQCHREEMVMGGRDLVLVDTPGLCDAERTDQDVMQEIQRGVALAAPGPHVFLFVISCSDRFTKEDQDAAAMIQTSFGVSVLRHVLVLLTCGDQLKKRGKDVEDFIGDELRLLVDRCDGGFYVLDNRDEDASQVSGLLQQIQVLVQKNGDESFFAAGTAEEAAEGGGGAAVRRRVALSVNGGALAGAGLGGALAHLAGSSIGIPAGAAAGAAVGGVMGGVGIVTAEYVKRCEIQ